MQCFVGSFHAAVSQLRAQSHIVPSTPPVLLKLMHAVAEPAGLYGSEIWGVFCIKISPTRTPGDWLSAFYSLDCPLERSRCSLLRRYLRLPSHVPKICLLYEVGCYPLVHQYVLRAARFYNTLLDAGVVYTALLRQHVQDGFARPSQHPIRNWIVALHDVLSLVHPRGQHMQRIQQQRPINIPDLKEALRASFKQHVQQLAAVREGAGARIGAYFRDMATHSAGSIAPYLSLSLSRKVMYGCMRLRLGCHYLRLQTGRWSGLARSQRLCLRCPLAPVDDEHHCMYVCTHSRLQQFRAQLLSYFQGHVPLSISALFRACHGNKGHWCQVAKYLAVCYYVSEACYHAGGTDEPVHPQVPMLPELSDIAAPPPLSPANPLEEEWLQQPVDLFDSDTDDAFSAHAHGASGDHDSSELVELLSQAIHDEALSSSMTDMVSDADDSGSELLELFPSGIAGDSR